MSGKYLWMKVDLTNDELPLIVADSAGQLARKCGCSADRIYSAMHKAKIKGYRCKYVKVKIDE